MAVMKIQRKLTLAEKVGIFGVIITILLTIIIIYLMIFPPTTQPPPSSQQILPTPTILPQQDPIIHNFTSDKRSGQLIGTDITWTVYATDLNNDTISYRFLLKGPQDGQPKVQQGWSTINTWTWATSKYENGFLYEVSCQIRDNNEVSSEYNTESSYPDFRLIKVDCPLTDVECINDKGWNFYNAGNFESALICFNKSVELDSLNPRIAGRIGVLL